MQQTDLDYSDDAIIINISKDQILPEGKYFFVEFYCTDPQCDCNSGVFQMVELDPQGKETENTIALIDYTWTEPVSTHNPSLGPQFIGFRLAEAGLEEFKKLLTKDGDMVAKLKSSYIVTREEHPHPEFMEVTPIQKGTKVGRNEPCPCGSGKKYKKCCL